MPAASKKKKNNADFGPSVRELARKRLKTNATGVKNIDKSKIDAVKAVKLNVSSGLTDDKHARHDDCTGRDGGEEFNSALPKFPINANSLVNLDTIFSKASASTSSNKQSKRSASALSVFTSCIMSSTPTPRGKSFVVQLSKNKNYFFSSLYVDYVTTNYLNEASSDDILTSYIALSSVLYHPSSSTADDNVHYRNNVKRLAPYIKCGATSLSKTIRKNSFVLLHYILTNHKDCRFKIDDCYAFVDIVVGYLISTVFDNKLLTQPPPPVPPTKSASASDRVDETARASASSSSVASFVKSYTTNCNMTVICLEVVKILLQDIKTQSETKHKLTRPSGYRSNQLCLSGGNGLGAEHDLMVYYKNCANSMLSSSLLQGDPPSPHDVNSEIMSAPRVPSIKLLASSCQTTPHAIIKYLYTLLLQMTTPASSASSSSASSTSASSSPPSVVKSVTMPRPTPTVASLLSLAESILSLCYPTLSPSSSSSSPYSSSSSSSSLSSRATKSSLVDDLKTSTNYIISILVHIIETNFDAKSCKESGADNLMSKSITLLLVIYEALPVVKFPSSMNDGVKKSINSTIKGFFSLENLKSYYESRGVDDDVMKALRYIICNDNHILGHNPSAALSILQSTIISAKTFRCPRETNDEVAKLSLHVMNGEGTDNSFVNRMYVAKPTTKADTEELKILSDMLSALLQLVPALSSAVALNVFDVVFAVIRHGEGVGANLVHDDCGKKKSEEEVESHSQLGEISRELQAGLFETLTDWLEKCDETANIGGPSSSASSASGRRARKQKVSCTFSTLQPELKSSAFKCLVHSIHLNRLPDNCLAALASFTVSSKTSYNPVIFTSIMSKFDAFSPSKIVKFFLSSLGNCAMKVSEDSIAAKRREINKVLRGMEMIRSRKGTLPNAIKNLGGVLEGWVMDQSKPPDLKLYTALSIIAVSGGCSIRNVTEGVLRILKFSPSSSHEHPCAVPWDDLLGKVMLGQCYREAAGSPSVFDAVVDSVIEWDSSKMMARAEQSEEPEEDLKGKVVNKVSYIIKLSSASAAAKKLIDNDKFTTFLESFLPEAGVCRIRTELKGVLSVGAGVVAKN